MEKRIGLVLLAAGDSRRFGGNKLLSNIAGMPMYRHLAGQIETLPAHFFAQRILVTQYEEIAADLAGNGYQIVRNQDSCMGISHSIHLALAALDSAIDAVCFAVCDQPWLKGETLADFLTLWAGSEKGIGCLSCRGQMGNPAVFSRVYFPELLMLHGDVGGKRVLKQHMDDLYLHEVTEEKELTDIDEKCLSQGL